MQVVVEAMKKQIQKPAKAVVNSESAFVKYEIAKEDSKLATFYWNWVCMGKKKGVFSEEVEKLQEQLDAIDAGISMPSWGTYGT